jgi:cysteine synthase A
VPVYHSNQWDSLANRQAHYESTGPEIAAQMDYAGLPLHAFSCAMGTGGTLAGVSQYLREHVPGVQCFLTDPQGAVPHTFYTTGEAVAGAGSSFSEGIGQGRITGNMEGFRPDASWEVTDVAAMAELDVLAYQEGLQVGLSSGINVAGAIEVAKRLGPGHNLVTVLCDGSARYASKMFNPAFLRSKGVPVPAALSGASAALEARLGLSRPLAELVEEAREPKQ